MMRIFILLIFTFTSSLGHATDSIVGDISSKTVSINTTFTGSDILIFGSIKRSNNEKIIPSDIIIEVLGPKANITIREKEKKFGIWVNSNPQKIYDSPSFYSILYTKNLENILSPAEQNNNQIGEKQFFDSTNSSQSYREAVSAKIRIKVKEGSYMFTNDPIIVEDDTLFSARVSLPASLIEGDYKTKIYLVQKGKVIDFSSDIIKVRKIGLEKWLYRTAHEQSLFYGVFSILLALLFGWGASTLFRRYQK